MIVQRLWRNVKLGVKTLILHKLRSVLTMLGVVFGVASVIAMLAVGEGASAAALERIRELGSTNIIIQSQKPTDQQSTNQRTSVYGLTYADAARIEASFDRVERVVSVKSLRREGRLGQRTADLRVMGVSSGWFDLVDRRVIAGRTLDAAQRGIGGSTPVVLTETGARKLLATRETLGSRILIAGSYFEVVGIVAAADAEGVETPDSAEDAYIPLEVARERFGDLNVTRSAGSFQREQVELHQMLVRVKDESDVEPVSEGIEHVLSRFRSGSPDYRMSVPLALLRDAEETKRQFNLVLGSIAGISLLVGGIGIMNIMLASVTERIKEIGIRRAIGARKSQIVGQFLIETVVLSVVGGVIGIGLGVLIPALIEWRVADMPTEVKPWTILLAGGISVLVGLVFGIYPAARAAGLDPIVALRHE